MEPTLIYDVGMANGDDTAYYLTLGYRVVAIEANPRLVELCNKRFRAEVERGQLTILNAGLWDSPGVRDFWVNKKHYEHSSFVREIGSRGQSGTEIIQVDCVTARTILENYGTPYYLKIDVEMADGLCLQSMTGLRDLPRYISVEASDVEWLVLLHNLGYKRFQLVDQAAHNHRFKGFSNENPFGFAANFFVHNFFKAEPRLGLKPKLNGHHFPYGSSGPFGEHLPGKWRDFNDVLYEALHWRKRRIFRGRCNHYGWPDFHASLF